MEWNQVITIIGTNVALFASMSALIIWTVNKLDSDIKTIATRMDGHAQRIDQLYLMYCESQKENADRFYTLLKEIHKKQ